MRLFLILMAAEIAGASIALADNNPSLADRMFCDYVAEFAPQIARNRIREVPFLRLDEFSYFDKPRNLYLKRTAEDLYSQEPETLRLLLDGLGDAYAKECRDAFDQN